MKNRYGKHDYGLKACVLVVLGTVIFLTIGYAQFTNQLGIYGISATVRVHKDVRIGGISLSNATNDGISNYEEYNVKDIYSSVTLPNANSSITYDVKVLNLGNVEMGILNISGLPNNLTYSISNYNIEDPLCDDNDSSQCKLGVEKTLHITISYKENGFDENNITYPLDLSFDFKRIYTITYNGFTSTAGLPTSILEDDTKTITFNNTTGIPSNVLVTGATGNYVSPTLTITDPSENVTIYKKHLITYELDGGTQAENQVTTIASNESVTLLDPTKEEYNFGGWYNNSSFEGEPITVLSNVTSDITLYAQWTEYDYFIKRKEFDGTVGNVINTGIALYSAENVNRNFRIKFTIDSYDNSYDTGSINKAVAPTILSSMDESGSPWPGFVYRVQGVSGSNKYYFQINDSHVINYSTSYNLVSGIDVEIVRENGIMYTKVNDIVYTKVLTYKDNIDTFDIPLTIGGNINADGDYDRTFKGVLSNVSIEFYEGSIVNNTDYTYTETRTSTSYNLDGTIEFDGTNYIDTGINLFSAENINKDFEISLTINQVGGNVAQATLMNLKDEGQNNVWPGVAYRTKSGGGFEFSARWPGQSNVSLNETATPPKTIALARRNGIIYYSINGSEEATLIATPASSLNTAFGSNLTFGASLNGSGSPFRYFTGVVSNISVELFDN